MLRAPPSIKQCRAKPASKLVRACGHGELAICTWKKSMLISYKESSTAQGVRHHNYRLDTHTRNLYVPLTGPCCCFRTWGKQFLGALQDNHAC